METDQIILKETCSLMDFVCWVVALPQISKLMLNLAQAIGYLGFGMYPDSLTHELELIWYNLLFQSTHFFRFFSDIKSRLKIEDLTEWFIVPSEWWSQLIVMLSDSKNKDTLFIETIPSLNSKTLVDANSKISKAFFFDKN